MPVGPPSARIGSRVADFHTEEPLPPLHLIDSKAPGSARMRKELVAAARAAGYRVVAGWAAPLGGDRVVCSGWIRTADDARRALLAAISGAGLVVVVATDRLTLDRFVDDLRRLGRVELEVAHGRARPTRPLPPDQRRVLGLLSEGLTLDEVAQMLGSSGRAVARCAAAARRGHDATDR